MTGQRDAAQAGVAILAKNEISLKVNEKALAISLIKVVLKGSALYMGTTSDPSEVATNLVEVSSAISLETDRGTRAWRLIALAIGWTFDQIHAEFNSKDELRRILRKYIKKSKLDIIAGSIAITPSFVSNPANLDIFVWVREKIISERKSLNIRMSSNALRSRLDVIFNKAVFEIYSRSPETYSDVMSVLTSPLGVATEIDAQWGRYRNRLRYDFEAKPMFGQEDSGIPLEALYIPLRAVWKERNKNRQDDDAVPKFKKMHVVMLEPHLQSWCDDKDRELLIIGGGPGSGKSTSLKAFAALLAKSDAYKPLYIPLQHISIDMDLTSSINRYFTEYADAPFSNAPLNNSSMRGSAQVVLIFDGLDEIAKPGATADQIAQAFVAKLLHLAGQLRGMNERPVKILVSGRLPSYQATVDKVNTVESDQVELIGYGVQATNRVAMDKKYESLFNADLRESWWKKYSKAVGISSDIPMAFKDTRLLSLTNEPLLVYLLVLSGYVTDRWEEAADNRNLIYERLIDEIWERGWGEGSRLNKRAGQGRSLSKDDFIVLMETIALAAWKGGDARICSEAGFFDAVLITKCKSAWDRFKAEGGDDVTNLAMNFYLKSADLSARGFEFTHKSFGEYLVARALIKIADRSANLVQQRIGYAMDEWHGACGTGKMTGEVLLYIRDEVRIVSLRRGVEYTLSLKEGFQEIALEASQTGFTPGTANWKESEVQQRNSEIATWAILNALFRAAHPIVGDRALIKINWPNKIDAFRSLIQRVNPVPHRELPLNTCFSGVVAPQSRLFALFHENVDLSYCDLTNSNFSGGWLANSKFVGTKLEDSRFFRCSLDNATFEDASMDGVSFYRCTFRNRSPLSIKSKGFNVDKWSILSTDYAILKQAIDDFNVEDSGRIVFADRLGGGDSSDLRTRLDLLDSSENIIFSKQPVVRRRRHVEDIKTLEDIETDEDNS